MRRKQIMVVDDDPITLEVVSRVLRSEGFDVVRCDNGPKAVHQALESKPDLVILDLAMPSPDPRICPIFDGLSVLGWLNSVSLLRDTPVIILSAKPAAEHKGNTLAAGAMAYIQKPFDRSKLVSAVRIALDDGSVATPNRRPVHSLAELERLYPHPSFDDTNWRMSQVCPQTNPALLASR